MKILYITTISNTINAFLIPHIKMLIANGHTVDVATNNVNTLDPVIKKIGCKVFNVPFSRNPLSRSNYSSYNEMKNILNRDYNIIHVHTPVASMIARFAARRYRKRGMRVIYTVHGFHFHKGASLLNWLVYYPVEKILSYYTDDIITINDEDFALSKKKFKNTKTHFVPGVGINLEKFYHLNESSKQELKNKFDFREHDLILTYVAELNDNKNQMLLLEFMNSIKKEHPQYKLLLVGTGKNKKQYQSFIQKKQLNNSVYLLGHRKDIVELLSITDIYVASSLREGLPVNIMEAMAMGLPILATENRGHRMLINDGLNGFYINQNNILEKIMKISQDANLKDKFAYTNLTDINDYRIELVLQEISDIYGI